MMYHLMKHEMTPQTKHMNVCNKHKPQCILNFWVKLVNASKCLALKSWWRQYKQITAADSIHLYSWWTRWCLNMFFFSFLLGYVNVNYDYVQ